MWYALIHEEQVGPLDVPALVGLYQQGQLDDGTFVWHEGMADWVPFETVPELAAAVLTAQSSGAGLEQYEESDEEEGESEGATLMIQPDDASSIAQILASGYGHQSPLAAAVSAPLRAAQAAAAGHRGAPRTRSWTPRPETNHAGAQPSEGNARRRKAAIRASVSLSRRQTWAGCGTRETQ